MYICTNTLTSRRYSKRIKLIIIATISTIAENPYLAQAHVQVPLTRRVGNLAVAADGDAVGVSHPATPDGASLAVLIAPNLQTVLVGRG